MGSLSHQWEREDLVNYNLIGLMYVVYQLIVLVTFMLEQKEVLSKFFFSVEHYIGQYGSGIVQYVGDIAFIRNGDCVVSNNIPNAKGNGIIVFVDLTKLSCNHLVIIIIQLVSSLIKQDISM